MAGSRLVQGEVLFARIVSRGTGVLHGRVGILMPGERQPPLTRFSIQLFVWRDDRWVVVALENARVLSLETMAAMESPRTTSTGRQRPARWPRTNTLPA